MITAKFKQGQDFKKIIESIKDLVGNANFEFSDNGIQMQAMDASHVALVNLILKYQSFSEFRVDKSILLGIKLQNLSKMLKCSGNDDIITLEHSEDQNDLTLKFESKNNDRLSVFNLNLIQLTQDNLTITDQNHSCKITMSSSEFAKICKELSSLSDNVKIETLNKKTLCFSIQGENGNGSIEIEENNSENINERTIIEIQENISNNFSLNFLNIFNKASSISSQVHLYLSENTPLVIEYKIDDYGSLKFYLAPRLNEDN